MTSYRMVDRKVVSETLGAIPGGLSVEEEVDREDGCSNYFRNVSNYLPIDTGSSPRQRES
jgi:hypothetical protein